MSQPVTNLPLVLTGPILRQCSATRLVIWMAVREPVRFRLRLITDGQILNEQHFESGDAQLTWLRAGKHLNYALLDIAFDPVLPNDTWIQYALELQPLENTQGHWFALEDLVPNLCYPAHQHPGGLHRRHPAPPDGGRGGCPAGPAAAGRGRCGAWR